MAQETEKVVEQQSQGADNLGVDTLEVIESQASELFNDKEIMDGLNLDIKTDESAGDLLNMIRDNPDLLNDPQMKQFHDLAVEQLKKSEQQNSDGDGKSDDKTKKPESEAKKGQEQNDNKGTEDDDDEDAEIDESKNPFLTKKGKKAKLDDVTSSKFNETLAQELSIDITTDDGAKTAMNSIRKFRQDSAKLAKAEKEVNGYKEFLTNLPKQMLVALDAYIKGEDYQQAFSSYKGLDFSKDWATLNDAEKLSVVNHYFGIDTTGKDLKDDTVSKLLPNVERVYNREKQINDSAVQTEVEKANQFKTEFANSIKQSADSFKIEYPDFPANVLKSAIKTLENGSYRDLFVNKTGMPKPDALKKLIYASYGEDYVKQLVNAKAAKDKSTDTADKIKKENKTPDIKSKGSNNSQALDQEVVKQLGGFTQLLEKQTY